MNTQIIFKKIYGEDMTLESNYLSPVENLGAPILTIGGVDRPWGVAVNQRGEVVVAEWEGHRVSVFSPSGEKLRSFGTHGSGPGEVLRPREAAVDGEGNILLADLNLSGTFGRSGSGKGQFDNPWGIACDSTGKVYVADCYNHRIQVFTAEGKFLHKLGRRGQGRGELDKPVGIAIDTSGMVYVSERGSHCVSVFTSESQFVTSFGRKGDGPGEFEDPYGLAVDNSGVVYVCDYNRVQLF